MGTVNSNFLPNSTGLDLGSPGQKWDVFSRNVTADSVTSGTTNPALSGTIRLASTDFIAWRNNANNGDITLSSTGAGLNNVPQDTFVFNSGVEASSFISSTSLPATTGEIRLAKSDAINFRNNTNGGDIVALSINGSDQTVVGGAAGMVTNGPTSINGAFSATSVSATGGTFQSAAAVPVVIQVPGSSGGGASLLAAGGTTGGNVAITGGAGSAGNGGTVTITGGNSATSATGGDVVLVPGTGASSQGRCILNGSTTISNKIGSYNGFTTGGQGVPVIVAAVTATGQTAAIGSTTLYTATQAGLYRLNYSLTIDTAGNAVNLTGTFGWQDAATHTLTTANILCSTLGANSTTALGLGNICFAHSSGFNITYATSLSGGIGIGVYTLRLILELLG